MHRHRALFRELGTFFAVRSWAGCITNMFGFDLRRAQPTGRVEIAWTLDPKTPDQKPQRLHLTWSERNGPAVQVPEKRSFGTRLIETLGNQLKGDVHLTYEPAGFVYALDVPLASLTSSLAQ